MKRPDNFSIERGLVNSRMRLSGRQISLLSSLVLVTSTLSVVPSAIPDAAKGVSAGEGERVAKFPSCISYTYVTVDPFCFHRGGKYRTAATHYFSAGRCRASGPHIRSHVASWSQQNSRTLSETLQQRREQHQRCQQGPNRRQGLQHQLQRYEAVFLLDRGTLPPARDYNALDFRTARGAGCTSARRLPLFLPGITTAASTANSRQQWVHRGPYSMNNRGCPSISLSRNGAVQCTPCSLGSDVAAKQPLGRRFGIEYENKHENGASVASVMQSMGSVSLSVVRLCCSHQHDLSAAFPEERVACFGEVARLLWTPPENTEYRHRGDKRKKNYTALKAGLAAFSNTALKGRPTSFVGSLEDTSPWWRMCCHEGGAPQASETVADKSGFPFPRLGLFPNFIEALRQFGAQNATEIQQLGLPAILSGANVVLGAETGSGKTLGYLLGILQNVLIQKMLHERKEDEAMMNKDDLPLPRHYPYAIIVVPTRELALQVTSWSRRLCRKTPIRTQLLLGSYVRWPFGTLTLPTSPDVILCTPQVLAGFTRGGGYKKKLPLFDQVQMLVIDEADMLLEGGYKKQMESIFLEFRQSDKRVATAGGRRTQYVFAAATIPERGPLSIRKTIANLCPGASFLCTSSLHCQKKELHQEFLEIPTDASFDDRIQLLLKKLQQIPSTEKVMIFCNTGQTAKHVLQMLEKTLPPYAKPKLFSSDLEQADRTRNLGLFAREKSKVLVCTDAASRGLDIEGVSSIIQFDFALDAVSHLHRVGRVARAGRPGRAINFYEPKSKPLVDAVRQAASGHTHGSLADIFSRKRSFRKNLKKGENDSVALVVDFPAHTVGSLSTLCT